MKISIRLKAVGGTGKCRNDIGINDIGIGVWGSTDLASEIQLFKYVPVKEINEFRKKNKIKTGTWFSFPIEIEQNPIHNLDIIATYNSKK